jgi:uracil-DNA glycosylase family 4
MIKNFNDWVLGNGPSSAKLFICGDLLGPYDEKNKVNFSGPSGELLSELLEIAGSKRSQTYITNIVKIGVPDSDPEQLTQFENPQTGKSYEINDFLDLLWNEIEALRPNCILALGPLASQILTGFSDIKNYRGSILKCTKYPEIKVIPTINPAALFQRQRFDPKKKSGQAMFTWKQKAHIQFDFIKAVRESASPEFPYIHRELTPLRSSLSLQRFFNSYLSNGINTIYIDTEVYKATLVCIGGAFNRYEGVSTPLIDLQTNDNPQGIPMHELREIWEAWDELLADDKIKKCGQNFKADKVYWLERSGFTVRNFHADGMFKWHTISPELPKSLAFQASILSNEPFWKSEGREYNPHKDKLNVLLKYNAKDCCLNCECMEEMDESLKEFGLESFFYDFVMPLYSIYEKIEKKGILIDKVKQQELNQHYGELLAAEGVKRLSLLSKFGIEKDINYNSPKQVGVLIFDILKCPRRKDTRDDTLTALISTKQMKSQDKKDIINSILDSRSLHKTKETYVEAQTDYDGRMRTTYNQVGTETGRTSTGTIKKPLRNGVWGIPFQTVPRPDEFGGRCREMYIPDEEKVFLQFDQSQAEARIVALLAEDYEFLALFDILDVHKLTASFCYGLSDGRSGQELIKAALAGEKFPFLDLVIDEQRQIGKNTRHGCNYALGIEGLSIKQKISMYRAKQTMEKIHEMSPKIRGVFHETIQSTLANSRVMYTPFGRRREFFGKWGDELFREAYAHIPQSVIGDNTKRALLALDSVDWIEVLQEGHDSFLTQIPIGKEEECYNIVKPIFEQPIDFNKGTIKRDPITIPVGCEIGYSWGTLKKVKF